MTNETTNENETPSNRHQQKRQHMLEEARRLFWFKGFDGTRIKDIAEACACTQGNIYAYFKNKEDMLYQVLLDEMLHLVKAIEPLEHDRTLVPEEQLAFFIKAHVKHTVSPGTGKMLFFETETNNLTPAHRVEIVRLRDTYDRILRRVIRSGKEAGVFAADANEKLANFAIASTITGMRLWYSTDGELSLDALADGIYVLFANGLGARSGTAQLS